jgi:multiple sugar transport system permease protein
VWRWILNPDKGLLNVFLQAKIWPWPTWDAHHFLIAKLPLMANPPGWLQSREFALPAFMIMSLWGVGGGMIIYLAGLQSIPTQLYEAADIDGAGWWTRFWKITLPMMSPTIFFNLIIGIISSLQVFASAFVVSEGNAAPGGPAYATLFYLLYLYQKAFQYFRMGYASAIAWMLFMIILVCTVVAFKTSSRWVYYESDIKRR